MLKTMANKTGIGLAFKEHGGMESGGACGD